MGFWWRLFRYRLWGVRRVATIGFLLIFCVGVYWTVLMVDAPGLIEAVSVLTASILAPMAVALVLACSPKVIREYIITMLVLAMLWWELIYRFKYFGIVGENAGYYISVVPPMVATLLILNLPLPFRVFVGASKRIDVPETALANGLTAAEFVFDQIRPTHGVAFPGPDEGPRIVQPDGSFLGETKPGVGGKRSSYRVRVLEEARPYHLMLEVENETRRRKKTLRTRQIWSFDDENGSVKIRVRETHAWTLLSLSSVYLLDLLGDWLNAVASWISGAEMLSDHGRRTNRAAAQSN